MKYLKEDEPQIEHLFDFWHFSKNIKCKLTAAGTKSFCTALQKSNHFWWACAISEGNDQQEKWVSVLLHVPNKHSWTTSDLFSKCKHPKLTKKQIKLKEWLLSNSDALNIRNLSCTLEQMGSEI